MRYCTYLINASILTSELADNMMLQKGGKRSLPFLLVMWGSRGQRFKDAQPNCGLRTKRSGNLSGAIAQVLIMPANLKVAWHAMIVVNLTKEENNERS